MAARYPLRMCALVVGLVLLLEPGWVEAQDAQTQPAKPKVVLTLGTVAPPKLQEWSLADLRKAWPYYKRPQGGIVGFNHLTLPFLYECKDADADANEALAFSFLMSGSLDWTPGCFCSRHAYFAFKRSSEQMTYLAKEYDADLIGGLVEEWSATHAVGGTLRKTAKGFSGTLKIFDHQGKVLLTKDYGQPREYFMLLGDMAVDAMKHFGGDPSKALVEHLHRKRCKDMQSIRDLGKAAFAEEKTEAEFGLYKKILQRDPDFADVRAWYASQKRWDDNDDKAFRLESGKALDSYPVSEAFREMYSQNDPANKDRIVKWRADVVKLVGEDFPALVETEVVLASNTRSASNELLAHAAQVAQKAPNQYWLLCGLSEIYLRGGSLQGDADQAASYSLGALQSLYITANSGHFDCVYNFAEAMGDLGHRDMAAVMLQKEYQKWWSEKEPNKSHDTAELLAGYMAEQGRHELAAKLYMQAYDTASPSALKEHECLPIMAGASAAMAGKLDLLKDIISENRAVLKQANLLYVLETYQAVLENKEVADFKPQGDTEINAYDQGKCVVTVHAQVDLLHKKSLCRNETAAYFKLQPNLRSFWILMDAYDRQERRPESAYFYRMLEWLHGDDAWVKQAVGDYRKQPGKEPAVNIESVRERLSKFRWDAGKSLAENVAAGRKVLATVLPGEPEAAILELIRQKQFDKALELQQSYHGVACYSCHYLRVHSSHLFHLIQAAKEKDQSAAGGRKG